MKITTRALVMGSALVLTGGWFGFDYFGDRVGLGSPIRLSRGAADGGQTLPVKISGGIGPSESQLASINPLSGISLVSLSQTVERPLFNRTRAPKPKPEPQVVEQAVEPEAGPEDFTLLGIVVANDDKTVVLRFNKTNEVFHLKAGQSFSDWQLADIGPKSVVVKKADLSFSLELFDGTHQAVQESDDEQQQLQQPQQPRRPLRAQQLRQHRQVRPSPQLRSRQPADNNSDDSDSDSGESDDQPQAVSRLEHG